MAKKAMAEQIAFLVNSMDAHRENLASDLNALGKGPKKDVKEWRRQEGSLCAQHCLNALLQAHYFTAVELATIGHQIDEEERSRMAEGGVHSEDYQKFLQQPSSNVDDSGYFSVQVIASALKVWGLELIPYSSQNPLAQKARNDPTQLTAYICNFHDHWLTVRKIGSQWFNLNSLLMGPELISDTFLALYLKQLQAEGYSIFIVDGKLPECSADRILQDNPAVQIEKPKLISEVKGFNTYTQEDEDKALNDALQLTLDESQQIEEECMQVALKMSLSEFEKSSSSQNCLVPSTSRDNQRFLPTVSSPEKEMTEQEMLEAAIKMSMESS